MNTQASYFKKALIMLMAVMMALTMMPSMAWAEGEDTEGDQTAIEATGYVNGLAILNADEQETEVFDLTLNDQDFVHDTITVYDGIGAITDVGIRFTGLKNADKSVGSLYCSVKVDGSKPTSGKYKSDRTLTKETTIWFDTELISTLSERKYGHHTITLEVGQRDKTTKTLINPTTYTFNVTYVPTFTRFSFLDDSGDTLNLTPPYLPGSDQTEYFTTSLGDTLKIKEIAYNASNGVKLYVGDTEWTEGQESISLENFTDENGDKNIPFKLKADDVERTITLRSGNPDFAPKVTNTLPDIECDKNDAQVVRVEVENAETYNLSYQWYRGTTEANMMKIEGETNASYNIPTNRAGTWYYNCIVTNTINGQAYSTALKAAKIKVRLSSVSEPVILKQPGTYTWNGTAETVYRTEYMQGEKLDPMYIRVEQPEQGVSYGLKFYCEESDGKPTELQGKLAEEANSSSETIEYKFIPDATLNVGESSIYCIITATADEDSEKSASTKSASVTVKCTKQGFSMTGEGTAQDPYKVEEAKHFEEIRDCVNAGNSLEGVYFEMVKDVELPEGWEPIGCTKDGSNNEKGNNLNAFSGIINGGGKTLTIPENGLPLLRYVNGATVKNLNIFGSKINSFGLVDRFTGVGLDRTAITIEKVTLKKGTSTLKSGFIGTVGGNGFAGASANCVVIIRDCTVEAGVTIGYSGEESDIASFAGRINGRIENCTSSAEINGKDYVGGILGSKDNSMGECVISECQFDGKINATGSYVGGIAGGGYGWNSTAPNAYRVTITACKAAGTVNGKECVGGILGGDQFVAQTWDAYSIIANSFKGKISGEKYVGGIIGYYNSLNKFDTIVNNFYTKNCGAKDGIGFVKYLDTSYKNPTTMEGTIAFSTEKGTGDCPPVKGCGWKVAHNRTDDPLGADKEKLTRAIDSIPDTAFCYELIMNGTPKTEYYIGNELDFTGVTFTAKWTDGTETHPIIGTGENEVKVTGYNKNSHSVQTVILSCGYAQTTIQVAVLKDPSSSKNSIKVKFTLLGDDKHGESETAHTLSGKNLTTWIAEEEYTLDLNSTAGDLFKKALADKSLKWIGTDENKYNTLYVESIQIPRTTGSDLKNDYLGEFDNGQNSGWMYTINGTHPEVGVDARFLNNGDEMIFHYTDDYDKEEDASKWNSGTGTVEEVKNVTTDTKTGTTTAPTEVKVSEKTNADGTKTKVANVKVSADNQKEILKQAKEKKSNEIILVVSSKSVGDAEKAEVTLDKSFIDSIVKDTDAKLTIRTPFGDKTYTQEELKAMSEVTAGSTITVAIEKAAEEPTDDAAANIAKAKSIVKDLKLVARSSKTAKKNIKADLKSDAKVKASIKELKDLGFTVKYRFYRSTKKAASYKSTVTKKAATYTNTSGKKGTKYFYKVQVRVYDENGKLVAKTALKQCKYASRTWTK